MKRPALGHIVGYTALTVILTAGAAQSLSGSNTVFSDDIAPGNVRGSDLAANSVSSGKILNGSVKGSDVKDGSLTGTDINESTLVLPTASDGAFSKSVSYSCSGEPLLSDGTVCGSTTITMPSAGALVIEVDLTRSPSTSNAAGPRIKVDGLYRTNEPTDNSVTVFVGAGNHTIDVIFQYRTFGCNNASDCAQSASGTIDLVAIPAPAQP